MEINFRNDGNAYALTGAGYNLPYIWCKGMTDNSIEDEKNTRDWQPEYGFRCRRIAHTDGRRNYFS